MRTSISTFLLALVLFCGIGCQSGGTVLLDSVIDSQIDPKTGKEIPGSGTLHYRVYAVRDKSLMGPNAIKLREFVYDTDPRTKYWEDLSDSVGGTGPGMAENFIQGTGAALVNGAFTYGAAPLYQPARISVKNSGESMTNAPGAINLQPIANGGAGGTGGAGGGGGAGGTGNGGHATSTADPNIKVTNDPLIVGGDGH